MVREANARNRVKTHFNFIVKVLCIMVDQRWVQKYIETQIGKRIIKGDIRENKTITVDADDNGHVIV